MTIFMGFPWTRKSGSWHQYAVDRSGVESGFFDLLSRGNWAALMPDWCMNPCGRMILKRVVNRAGSKGRCPMGRIVVSGVPEDIEARLQRRAVRHGQSIEAEIRDILRDVALRETVPEGGLGTEIAELFKGVLLREGEKIVELRGHRIGSSPRSANDRTQYRPWLIGG
jgi:antitoxin FitA